MFCNVFLISSSTQILILWQNNDEAIIDKGLSAGEELVVTSLGQVSSGTKVGILGDTKPKDAKRGKQLKLSQAKKSAKESKTVSQGAN